MAECIGILPQLPVATEDQPRPTPPDLFGMKVKLDSSMPVGQIDVEDANGKRTTILEAQGEDPQPPTDKELCDILAQNCADHSNQAGKFALEILELRAKLRDALKVETGAHPSQDALSALKQWESDTGSEASFSEGNAFMDGWQAGAGSTPSMPSTQTLCSADIGKISPLRFICRHGDFAEPCKDCQGTFTNCGTPSLPAQDATNEK